MLLAALSDIHAAYSAVKRILDELPRNIDALLIGGDIEYEGIVEELVKHVKKVFAVPGNMDDRYIADVLTALGINIDGRFERLGSVWVAGIGSLEPYTSAERIVSEGVELKEPIILLTHHPPYGTKVDVALDGEHIGLKIIRDVIERIRPVLNVCGHVHESPGVDSIGDTVIVNPGPAYEGRFAIIEIDDSGKVIRVELRRVSLR